MLKLSQIKISAEISDNDIENALKKKIVKTLNIQGNVSDLKILKRSIDARKKPQIFYSYTVAFSVNNEKSVFEKNSKKKDIANNLSLYKELNYEFPYKANGDNGYRPVIIGSGPCGLFCAYNLAKAGFKPIVFERGKSVDERSKDVEKFWETGILDPSSNVQFGEGGAGTFSDGKLNTLIKDPFGLNKYVLETFVDHGAPEKILYDAKPHIGTDILKTVVKSIREEIISLGGEVRFNSLVSEVLIDNGRVNGVVVNGERFDSDHVVLAIGHSARDTFKVLYDSGISMEQKPFSVGFRVIHPQALINLSQYGTEESKNLGAADYKLTAKTDNGRGVFSFCMCPGGYVVNASSEEGMTAVNGMSYSKRDGKCANSAIIFTVDPSDYPSDHPLAGVEFQRNFEKKAFELGNGAVPIQKYGDFKKDNPYSKEHDLSDEVRNTFKDFAPGIKGHYEYADLRSIYTKDMNESFVQGMEHFDKIIPGFAYDEAILAGVESRTSSPVRINRDEDFQSNMKGLYPCGEGAGYAGGITSAAMDGIKVAEHVAKNILGL